jgi:hypothetical protein
MEAAGAIVFALMGYGMARRGPGWRIYTGTLGWLLIVTGVVNGFTMFPPSYAPRFASRVWMHAITIAWCVGLGWFILWSKRREPRPAPRPKDAAAA